MAYESEHGLSTGESNNSISTANLLTVNEKTIGSLSSSSDADYYKVVATGPGLINVTFDTGTYSSSLNHWQIALLDTAGQDYLLSPTRSTAGTSVQINGERTGTSLIVDGLDAAPTAGDRFTISTTGADTTIYTVVSTGTVSSGEATLTITPAITTAPADDAYLIFDPVEATTGTTTSLTAQVSAAGTYYLKVSSSDVASTQEYGVTPTFTSTVEVEDNDIKSDAADSNNRLLEGVSMTGNLTDDNDNDIWLFTTATASDFTLDFAATNGNDATPDWTITLTNWNGTSILDSTGSAVSLNAGTSASASITDEINGTAQTYIVTVDKHADKTGVSTSNYTLKVSGTNLDLNDSPSMTIGSVTSDSSNALVDTEVVRSVSAAESGDGEALAMTSLFSASDADSSQTLSYTFTLVKPTDSSSTGFIKVGETSYGFEDGMTSPVNVTLTSSQMSSAEFYPGTGTGDLTLYLQAKDDSGANDGSDLGAIMQMTLRSVSAGYKVNVTGADTATSLQESNDSSSDTISITLGQAPSSGETVTVYLEHGGEEAGQFELSFSTSVLTFTESNYDTAQSVTITAREDSTKETSQTGQLSFRVVSSDSSSAFNDLAVDTLTYTLTDASNHAPTGSVTVTGTTTQGETLTASNDIADIDGLGTITYLWEQSSDGSTGWTTISGSTTGSTYTLVDAQSDGYVRVSANYTDDEANKETVVSSVTAKIANINDAPTVAAAIDDQSAVLGRLFSYTFGSDTFSDVDPSDDGGTLTYTVKQITSASDTTEITGDSNVITGGNAWLAFDNATRTFSSSSVGGSDGDEIFVEVTATDNAATALSVTDIFKITVGTAATGTPVLVSALADQSVDEDSSLSYTVASGTFADTDNTNGSTDTSSSLTYTATLADSSALPTWLTFDDGDGSSADGDAGASVPGFSGTPTNSDVGSYSVKMTASDGTLSTNDIFTVTVANTNDDPTGAVDANSASVTVQQGNTLTASNTLADADGIGTISYQWQSSLDNSTWNAISGATSTTYALSQSVVGSYVRVVASYTDGYGQLESVNSDATAQVANINDAPTAAVDAATAVEAGGTSNGTAGTNPAGNLLDNDEDVDTGDTVTLSGVNGATDDGTDYTVSGSYGTLVVVKATGAYTYTVDNSDSSVQALRGSSNTLTDTFNYTITDGSLTDSENLVVTIQGANDAPTVATPIDDFGASATNKIYASNAWSYTFDSGTFADVDSGDTLTYSAVEDGQSTMPTWLEFDADTRTFSTTNAPAAATSVDITVTATDAGSLTVTDTFNITVQDPGTDAPTMTAPDAIALSDTASDDDYSTPSTGTLAGAYGSTSTESSSLVYGISGGTNSGDGLTVSSMGTYGTLTVTKADGSYSFAPNDSMVEALTADASEDFIVTVTDSSSGSDLSASRILSVDITATNDTPTLTAPTAISLTDTDETDTFSATSATLSANDLDTDSASLTFGITGGTDSGTAVSKTGTFGTLSVTKATGAYTFTPLDSAVNAAGGDESETYTVTVSDGVADPVSQTLTVSVSGVDDTATNDRPTLTSVTSLSGASESQAFSISFSTLQGAANESDDASVSAFRVEAVSNGTLTKSGAAVTAGETTLTTGQSLVWTPSGLNGTVNAFTIVAVDGAGLASLTPVQVTVEVAADGNLTSSGAVQNSDANETGLNADGTAQAAVDATGDALALMANITDAEASTMTVTHAKENSAGTLALVKAGTTSADGLIVTGLYGTLVVGADGSYSYTVNQTATAVAALSESETITDQFAFTLSTGSATGTQLLDIVIDGTNDAIPTGTDDTLTINEDETKVLALTDFGTFTDTASDAATSLQAVKITTLESAGALEYSADGSSWTDVTLDQEITGADIAAGQLRYSPVAEANGSAYATIGYKVGDGDAFSSSAYTLTIDVTAVADATVFGGDISGTATEDITTTAVTGAMTVSDADGGTEADITTQTDSAGTYGTFSIDAAGDWSYTLDNSDADTQALASGATATDTFAVAVGSGETQDVTVTITGINDLPTSSGGQVVVAAGDTHTFSSSDFGFTDVDTGAALSQVRIDTIGTLPTGSSLQLSGTDVTAGQEITAAELSDLVFTPAGDASGTDYANFTFSVHDGTGYSASTATMSIDAGYTLTGTAEFWKDGSKLEGVAVTVDTRSDNSAATTGAFSLEAIAVSDSNVTVGATLDGPADKTTSGLSLTDVLAGLKLYLGKSLPESYSSPYNYIAADFDADSDVDLSDVLNMLKYYLGKSTTDNVKPEWVFVDKADLSGNATDNWSGANASLSKTSTTPDSVMQDISADDTIELVGVLRGDVDGSWGPV